MLAFCKETGPAGLIYRTSKESKKIDSKEIWMHKFIDRESKNHYGYVRLGSQLFYRFAWYESHAEDEPKRTASKTRWNLEGQGVTMVW